MRMMKRNSIYCWVVILFFLSANQAFAQDVTADVRVRLSLAGKKSVYRTGEPIRLILSFTADEGNYQLNTTTTKPASPVDEILLSPNVGFANWLDEYSGAHRYWPDYSSSQKITSTPIMVELPLNDCVRFDGPGKYTVQVKTARVSLPQKLNQQNPPLVLTTNEVSFEVVQMSKVEEEDEVRRLSTLLDASRTFKDEVAISEDLSYLSGDASTREKVRRFLSPDNRRSGNSSQNIFLGLFIARDRALIVRLLEAALRDTTRPATSQLLHTLTRLRLMRDGVRPPSAGLFVAQSDTPDSRRSSEILQEYVRELAASLQNRSGESRTTTAMTVLGSLPKDASEATAMLGSVREILLQEFDNLHSYSQEYLLRVYWEQLRDPSLKPALERMLSKTHQPQEYLTRGTALKRLMELDLERSRPFVIAELRDPDSVVDLEVLGALRDETLPDADAAMLEQIRRFAPIKQNRDWVLIQHKALLVARYASSAIYRDLLETFQTWNAKWPPDARAGLLGYFARYNETQAIVMIEQALVGLEPGQDSSFLLDLTRSNYPDTVRDLLRTRLESEDPQVVSSAAYIMSKHGPADDLRLIDARLARWVKEWSGRRAELEPSDGDRKMVVQQMVQVNLIQSLLSGTAWKLPDEKIKQLKQSCITDTCRQYFKLRSQ